MNHLSEASLYDESIKLLEELRTSISYVITNGLTKVQDRIKSKIANTLRIIISEEFISKPNAEIFIMLLIK
ncbi:MAG: HAD-IA family hydrolase [Clostridia bacterium]